jgi:hypothetical protein
LSGSRSSGGGIADAGNEAAASYDRNEARAVLEAVESLLPMATTATATATHSAASARFLSGLLRCAAALGAGRECRTGLEQRLAAHLPHASLPDLLLPNLSFAVETLYDVDAVQRVVAHFLVLDQAAACKPPESPASSVYYDGGAGGGGGPSLPNTTNMMNTMMMMSPPSLSPLVMVARLLDAYLAEIAPDVNLKPVKFLALAEMLPEYSRICDDGVYRAIDIYLKVGVPFLFLLRVGYPSDLRAIIASTRSLTSVSSSSGSPLAQGGRARAAVPRHGLPEAVARGVHARGAERAPPAPRRRAGALLRAAAAAHRHRQLLHDVRHVVEAVVVGRREAAGRRRRRLGHRDPATATATATESEPES